MPSNYWSIQPELRVLFTSGYTTDFAGRELSLRDRQSFLQKPATPRQMLGAVRRSLDAKPAARRG